MDLIDREELFQSFKEHMCSDECGVESVCEYPCDAYMLIVEATKVDAVIPVKCKDCRYRGIDNMPYCKVTDCYVDPEHFCSMGVAKEIKLPNG